MTPMIPQSGAQALRRQLAACAEVRIMTQNERRRYLISYLLAERQDRSKLPFDENTQKRLLRSLLNVRMPKEASNEFLQLQNEYLQEEIKTKGITDHRRIVPIQKDICVWQGDITTLRIDAIVNAANSQMLGCFQPCHNCIDNAIHTFAGVQLRLICNDIMQQQGHEEETGRAKITPAFNLPSRYVIHTVGPVVQGELTENDCRLLKECYLSCLNLAVENDLQSIAFCCISTGVFGFPQHEAAKIAVSTVKQFQKQHKIKVVFNVFKDEDLKIYRELLL